MPNIYLKVLLRKALLRKSDILKTSVFKVEKVHIQVNILQFLNHEKCFGIR